MHDLPILDELGADLRVAFRRPARRRLRRWAAVPAVAVAAALAALLVGLDSGAPERATAAELLRRAARAAETAPAPFPRADQYFLVRSLTMNLMTSEPPRPGQQALMTSERRIWTSVKRPGRLEQRVVSATYPGATPEQRRELEGMVGDAARPFHIGRARYRLGSIELSRSELLAFPADPATIYARMRAQVDDRGHSPEGEVFTEIGDALRESPAPASLRAGLYGALALIPGIELVGDVTDRAGRRGVAVAFTEVGIRHELIFDPETSEMLAERQVLVRPEEAEIPLPAGIVIGDTAYLERAVVDELP